MASWQGTRATRSLGGGPGGDTREQLGRQTRRVIGARAVADGAAARAAARCARAVRGGRVAPTVRSRVGGGTSPPSSTNAARTRRTLADLKGGALKAGQLLSTVEMLFPRIPRETWRQTLTGLQEQGTPVPFATLEPVLQASWARVGATAFAISISSRRLPGPSDRCIAAPGGTAATWPSRFSTRASAKPSALI